MLHKSKGCGAVLPRDRCCQRDSGLSLSRESCSGAMKNDTKRMNRKDLSITRNSDRVFTNKYHLPSFSINSPTEDCNGNQSTSASQHSLDFHLKPSTRIAANVIKEKPNSDFATIYLEFDLLVRTIVQSKRYNASIRSTSTFVEYYN